MALVSTLRGFVQSSALNIRTAASSSVSLEVGSGGGDDHLLSRLSDRPSFGARLRSLTERIPGRAAEPVRVQEPLFSSGAPIEGVPSSVAAFLGPTTAGPRDTPVEVTSVVEYERTCGGLGADDTGIAVQLFFQNGGQRAYVIRTDAVESSGMQALAAIDIFNLLSIPGTSRLSKAAAASTVRAAASLCEERRAFYVVDAPTSLTPTNITAWKDGLTATANAALYFPGLRIDDPLNPGHSRDAPPSGAVAGVIARTDLQRGVWKAPAGTEATLRAVHGLTVTLSDTDSEHLAAGGVNPLQSFPGRGPLIWGARTLASAEASEWKYVPVRRLLLFIEESIDRGTQWAMFEPNDEPLWQSLRSSIESFLFNVWRSGALAGRTPEDAYFVRCDRMTMTQNDIDNGRLICLVGVAPSRPAEFVTVSHVTSVVPPPAAPQHPGIP
jgi:phage tail sheath protein FI